MRAAFQDSDLVSIDQGRFLLRDNNIEDVEPAILIAGPVLWEYREIINDYH